jgi:hypothetical protein
MIDLKSKTAIVVDNGLFCDLAARLGRDFGKVYYWAPAYSGFPKPNISWVGKGIDGIEVINDPFGDVYDKADIWIFPDVYFGELQTRLESQGKYVWGSRMGEQLELDRPGSKKLFTKLGLPVGHYEVVHGMDNLRGYLKSKKNVWVKISYFRGIRETFQAIDYKMVEPVLDDMEHDLGAFKNVIDFVVEDDLPDRFEVGVDCYCIDGQFPTKTLTGVEIKDVGYVGIFADYDKIPEPVTRFDRVISPVMRRYGYRGFYSTEVRIGKDQVPYMIDFCARAGSPPNELYQEFYKNISEIIWQGAHGICVDPEPVAKYGAEALIHSAWADKNWQPVDFPEEYRKFIKLRNPTRIAGRYYAIPQAVGLPEIGAVVGFGNTMQAAIDMVTKIAKEVRGYYIEVKTESFDQAQEEIEKAEKFGIKIF